MQCVHGLDVSTLGVKGHSSTVEASLLQQECHRDFLVTRTARATRRASSFAFRRVGIQLRLNRNDGPEDGQT